MWTLEITRAANSWQPNYLQQPLLIPKTRRGDVKTRHAELFLLLWRASLGRALNWQINRVAWHGHCACKLVAPITRHDLSCRLIHNNISFSFQKATTCHLFPKQLSGATTVKNVIHNGGRETSIQHAQPQILTHCLGGSKQMSYCSATYIFFLNKRRNLELFAYRNVIFKLFTLLNGLGLKHIC